MRPLSQHAKLQHQEAGRTQEQHWPLPRLCVLRPHCCDAGLPDQALTFIEADDKAHGNERGCRPQRYPGCDAGKFCPDGYVCIKDPFKPGCGPECLSLTSTIYISNSTRSHQVRLSSTSLNDSSLLLLVHSLRSLIDLSLPIIDSLLLPTNVSSSSLIVW